MVAQSSHTIHLDYITFNVLQQILIEHLNGVKMATKDTANILFISKLPDKKVGQAKPWVLSHRSHYGKSAKFCIISTESTNCIWNTHFMSSLTVNFK